MYRWLCIAFRLVGALVLTGCDSALFSEQTTLNLRLDAYIGDQPIYGAGDDLIDFKRDYWVDGRRISLHTAHMYISEITLSKAGGGTQTFRAEAPHTFEAVDASGQRVSHTVADKILLFHHSYGQDEHFLGLTEVGRYTGIRFTLGLEGLTNRVDGSQVSAAVHPLGSRGVFTTYWSPEKGYIFLRFDGRVDTDGDGDIDAPWAFHLGTPEFVHTLEFAHDFTLSPGEPAEIHFIVDYAQLIAGLDLTNANERVSYTTDNLPVARAVHAHIPQAFSLQGVRQVSTKAAFSP